MPISRRAVLAGGTAGAALVLTSCARTGVVPTPSTSRPPTATTNGLSDLLARLGRSVLTRDRGAFTALTSDRDPAFGSVADRCWRSLTALGLTELSWHPVGPGRALAADRVELLGTDALAHQVRVDWRVPGDRHPARQVLGFTTVGRGDALRWGGSERPAERVPTPIWSLEAVEGSRRGRATAITARSVDPTPWLQSLAAAAGAVSDRLPAAVRPGWNGRLVAEIPSTEAVTEAIVGAAVGSRSQIAAITWPESVDPERAPMRIVVNPAASAGLVAPAAGRLGLDLLLTHEATHVATRSPLSAAPVWLVEGLADAVAYDRWPAGAASAAADLLAAVAGGDGPSALPDDAAFAPGAPDLALRYAEAWLACGYVTAQWSWARLADLYEAAQTTATAAAIPAALGVTEARFTRGWLGHLADLAAGR